MLKFVFGPSGAGKSVTLYRELIERSMREPERRFFVLVPDQFTMQTQADVVRMHPEHAIMNIDVLSFSRLAHRVFDETGAVSETVLDDLGKTLLLRYVAGKIKKDLPLIGPHMHKAGYIDEVKSTLSELMQYDISPDKMSVLLEASTDRKLLHGKLKDLQTLYAAFRETVEKRYLTAEDTYTLVEKRITETGFAKDAVIAVDAFTGFTPVQYRVLSALYAQAAELVVTVTMGTGEDPYTGESLRDGSLYALGKKTVRDLRVRFHAAEQNADPAGTPPLNVWEEHRKKTAGDLFLQAGEHSRLHGNDAMLFLEQNLFRHHNAKYEKEQDSVHLFAASTPWEEARQVFRRIRALLREDDTLQYRDIAVLCADFETYGDLLKAAAADFEIPVYEDKTNSIRNNPLNGYICAVLEMVRANFTRESVMQYLRSALSFCERGLADELDLYLSANGIRGRNKWEKPFLHAVPRDRIRRTEEETLALLTRLDGIRTAFTERVFPLADAGRQGTVRDMTRALYTVFAKDEAERKLQELAARFEADGDLQRAGEYRQVFAKTVRLLEDVVRLLGDERLPFAEYARILEAGLSDLSTGTIPQNVDRVLTGDLQRTRLKEVKVLFLCGAGDRAIPHREAGGGFLSEIDRDFLRTHCTEVELAPSPAELLAIERLYLYMNLTKPSRALYLSHAAVDEAGKSARPSYLVKDLLRMFSRTGVTAPETDTLSEQTETRRDAKRHMGRMLRRYAEADGARKQDGALVPLFKLLAEEEDGLRFVRRAAFAGYRKRSLSPALASALFDAVRKASASRLELFAACPYAHFVRYGLRLQEKPEYDFDAADLGNVYHGVLEQLSAYLAENHISWETLTDEQTQTLVRENVRAFAAAYGNAVLYDTKRMMNRMDRVERVLVRTVKTLRYQLSRGSFHVADAEAAFSRVVSDGDRSMELYGRIDRVDIAREGAETYVKVMDFKSGRRDFDLTLLYHGLQLQLMLYMDAALARFGKEAKTNAVPAAMLYYHITDPIVDLDKESEEKDNDVSVDGLLKRSLRTTGIVNADHTVIGLLDAHFEKTSDVIPVARKSGGELTATSAVFAEDDYEALSDHTRKLTTSLYKKMRQGDIDVAPYELKEKNACTWCAYQGICAFDETTGYRFRALHAMNRKDALARIREEADHPQEEDT